MSFQEVLDDLQCRFIINVPEEELSSVERICFQIEQAHWFYEDFVREENPRLSSFSLKNFCANFFRHCPLLHRWAHDHETAFQNFMEYKVRVPVCGAIILNAKLDKAVLVRGWKSGSGWGFPKGKINKDEPEAPCAIREVYEETGFDIAPYLRENEYVERTIKGQRIRLYILTGVPENTLFSPQTRKEIGDIQWHRLDDLPGWNKNAVVGALGEKRHKFYMVTAFVSGLRQWMSKYRKAKRQGKARNGRHLSVVMGYNTGTDSEGEGGYTAAEMTGEVATLREPAVAEVTEPEDAEPMPVVPRVVDTYAAAQSIKAMIGIGGTTGEPKLGVRLDLQSQASQPMPQVAIGVSIDGVQSMHDYRQPPVRPPLPPSVQQRVDHERLFSQQPPKHMPPATQLPPQHHQSQYLPGPPFQQQQQNHQQEYPQPAYHSLQPPPPPRATPLGNDRQAHKKSLLDILTKGISDDNIATVSQPVGSSSNIFLPNPPRHPSFKNPDFDQSNAEDTESRYEEPPRAPHHRPSFSGSERGHPVPPKTLLDASGPGNKQQMLMDILRGGGGAGAGGPPLSRAQNPSSGNETSFAASSHRPSQVEQEASPLDEEAVTTQLRSILGIGRPAPSASAHFGGPTRNVQTGQPPFQQPQSHHQDAGYHQPGYALQHDSRQQQKQQHDLKAILGLPRPPPVPSAPTSESSAYDEEEQDGRKPDDVRRAVSQFAMTGNSSSPFVPPPAVFMRGQSGPQLGQYR
ncbi:mRNA-decapping enzyme subunit 2 [Thoreauomyces humboldtii]|nr:mRNA-decapping enzyme subunit 2 [Thoreauomyces humboldtii]